MAAELLIQTWMIKSYFILLQSILVPLSRSIKKNSLQYLNLVLKSYLKKKKRMTMTCRWFLNKLVFVGASFYQTGHSRLNETRFLIVLCI